MPEKAENQVVILNNIPRQPPTYFLRLINSIKECLSELLYDLYFSSYLQQTHQQTFKHKKCRVCGLKTKKNVMMIVIKQASRYKL